MRSSGDRVSGPWRYHRISSVGHWIPLAAPDELGALLIEYLRDLTAPAR